MILGKLASTNIVAAKPFKNFLAHFNSRAHDRQHPLFEGQESKLDKICLKTHENECLPAFLQIKNVFDTFGTHHWCFWIALTILNTLPTYLVLTRHVTVKIFQIFQRPYVKKHLKSIDFALELLLRAIWGVSISKNHCQLTFAAIRIDWGIARLPRLFLRIDMILGKLASTNIAVSKLFKNFLAHFNSTAHDRQHPLFEAKRAIWVRLGWKHTKLSVCVRFLK